MALVSSSSATVAVEKATSDLLIGPDWTMNIGICDSINSNHWLAKDVVKALKKRLQHKNSKVQLLALTLLETMVKNCGDYIHFQIAEKNILGEMVKVVKKKTHIPVRDKILVLLDSWQEAFGGPGGKHPQYYWAYEELRRSGVEFPQRSLDAAPIFTPPVSQSTVRPVQAGYGMPSNSSRRLDETMAAEIEGLSLSSLESMRNIMELLSDMLQAVNPDDREAVKEEIIVDLVNNCRSNQKKLMQMLTTTGDEELLGQGLELNDSLQVLLAKHDAIASGSPLPTQTTYLDPKPLPDPKPAEPKDPEPNQGTNTSTAVANVTKSYIDEEDEEEDDFAQLARRHSKPRSSPSQSGEGTSQALVPVDTASETSSTTAPEPVASNALALVDQPAPLSSMKEQEIIDLLSITLSTTPSTSHQPEPSYAPPASDQSYPYASQTYPSNQGQAPAAAYSNTYVVPWAQPQQQFQAQAHYQQPFQPQYESQARPQQQQQEAPQPEHQQLSQPQFQPQPQQHIPYVPPPWAATPGYANGQRQPAYSMYPNAPANPNPSYTYAQPARPMHNNYTSSSSRGETGSSMNGNQRANPVPSGQKNFIPSYRLFEDLNVFGNSDGRFNGSGPSSQGTVGGRK